MIFYRSHFLIRLFLHHKQARLWTYGRVHIKVWQPTKPYFNWRGEIIPTIYWCPHQVLKATGTPDKTFKIKSRVAVCFMPWLCIVIKGQNDHFHEGWKVRMSNATSINIFSVNSYDVKSMSFKFGNDSFNIFEMPGSSYQRPIGKNNISLLFRPSVIRGPWIIIWWLIISFYSSF